MSTRILIETSPGERHIAVVDAGGLLEYALWRPGAPDGVGDLCLGRVSARRPAMAGAFVALPATEGFLPDGAGGRRVQAGELIPVRVTRAAQGGKGPRLSADLTPEERALAPGSGPPRILRPGPSPAERLAARHPEAPVLADDHATVAALRPVLGERVGFIAKAFDETIMEQVAALAAPVVPLPEGGRIHIWPTPALTAIDIDAGAASAERRDKTAAQEALNRAAIPLLARQIRLRELSGAIYVDFAGLSPRRRAALGPALAAALARDPLRPRLLGFTGLGLAEIVRPRVHPALHELLAGAHAAGLAALARAEAALRDRPLALPTLRAAPDVLGALEADPVALPDFARRTGRDLALRADPRLPPGAWGVE